MPDRRRRSPPLFILWPAFAILLVASGGVLLHACGLLLPFAVALPALGWDFCPATPSALSVEAERGAALRTVAAGLELELGRKHLACASIPPPPPPPLELPTHAGQPRPQQTAQLKPSEMDQRLQREGARSGELQVSLAWDGTSDLDLYVICPSGEEIYYNHKMACGGTLDVDMNYAKFSSTPVENIFWPKASAPSGHFKVAVNMVQRRGDTRPAIPFTVRMKDGAKEKTVSGQIIKSGKVSILEFDR